MPTASRCANVDVPSVRVGRSSGGGRVVAGGLAALGERTGAVGSRGAPLKEEEEVVAVVPGLLVEVVLREPAPEAAGPEAEAEAEESRTGEEEDQRLREGAARGGASERPRRRHVEATGAAAGSAAAPEEASSEPSGEPSEYPCLSCTRGPRRMRNGLVATIALLDAYCDEGVSFQQAKLQSERVPAKKKLERCTVASTGIGRG